MITYSVPKIHCEGCVSRIKNAFKSAGISGTVSLEDKTVTVSEKDAAAALEELDDLGFSAEEKK